MTLIQRLLGRGRRTLAVAGLSVAALALAACGAGTDPLAEPSSGSSGGAGGAGSKIIVGSADFTESQILGELYAQAITAKGGDATTKPGIGSREVYIKALQDSSISVVPEYTGNLLLYFDAAATAILHAVLDEVCEKCLASRIGAARARPLQDSGSCPRQASVATNDGNPADHRMWVRGRDEMGRRYPGDRSRKP
jgi:osmoprotectant transport system substrate-binding protein